MRKEYIFYSALGALLAYELFINRNISTSNQYIEMIEVTAEVEAVKDIDGKQEAIDEVTSIMDDLLPIAIGIAIVPPIMKVISYFLEP